MKPRGERLDQRLVRDGLADSRSLAQRLIMAGQVRVNGQLVDAASSSVAADASIEVAQLPRFVSRAGDKLANALDDLADNIAAAGYVLQDQRAIDVGASTGGFTDCLLQAGAAEVVALDVGYGQLHPRIRDDARVSVMERCNARHLGPDQLPWKPQLLVCDVSFISVTVALPAVVACMQLPWWGIVLCKPQFEAGRARIGKGGVIRDEAVRATVRQEVIDGLASAGVVTDAWVEARPPGRKGNIEYALLVHGADPDVA